MDVFDFALLFIIGFIFGFFGRLIYARLTGRLGPEALRNENNVRYIDTAPSRKAETDTPAEQEQPSEKRAAN
ncbi:MAG: hypothetical protein ACYC56_01060 [Candidatus Aquicultor sp.]